MTKQLAVMTGFNALSPQQQEAHREKIGVRAQAILGQFWRDDATPDAVQALELEGWMDVLENCSHSEIRKAWATYQKTGPRTQSGKLYKPDAGALYRIIHAARPKPRVVSQQKQERTEPRVTAEAAQDILKSVGFNVNKFGGVGE
jgi:hypothetical protein